MREPPGLRRGLAEAALTPGPERVEWNLARFAHLLRMAGLRVSSAEVLDAAKALCLVGVAHRDRVKASLRATLIKSGQDVPLFERAFDLYFVPVEDKRARAEFYRRQREEQARRRRRAGQELVFQTQPLDLRPEQLDVYLRLGEEGQRRLRDFLDQSSSGALVEARHRSLVENIVRGHLDRHRRETGAPTGDEELDALADEVRVESEADPLLYQDLQGLEGPELDRAVALVRRLARRLATRISRRYRLTRSGTQVDFRRTIRRNIRFGGIPLRLAHRRRRVKRPRLVLVADVSGSMARYSRFVLQFLYGLASVVACIESFAFSERLERLTPHFARGRPFARTMAAVMGQSQIWGGGTDLAAALETLETRYAGKLTPDSVLVVVSDTKTVHPQAAAALLDRVGRRVKDVLWLNTLPRAEWRELASVRAFQACARMYECNTLAHLEQVITRQMLS
ncbi:MAG: VWA domain-containing protein [bacterium]|nr:VWA domain-containing protein [bacterium]